MIVEASALVSTIAIEPERDDFIDLISRSALLYKGDHFRPAGVRSAL